VWFAGTVNSLDGNQSLVVESGDGTVTFMGAVGNLSALAALTVNTIAGSDGVVSLEGLGTVGSPGVSGQALIGLGDIDRIDFTGTTYHANGQYYYAESYEMLAGSPTTFTTTSVAYYIEFSGGPIQLHDGSDLVVNSNSYAYLWSSILGTSDETVTVGGSPTDVSFGAIGGGDGILSVDVTSPATIILYGDIVTSSTAAGNYVTLNGFVVTSADPTIDTSAGGGAITLGHVEVDLLGINQTDLTLNAGAGTVTVGSIGFDATSDDINAVTITGFGGVTLGGDIFTGEDATGEDGDVEVIGPVELGADVIIDTSDDGGGDAGAIQFTDFVDSDAAASRLLTINAPARAVALYYPVGSTRALAGLDVQSASMMTLDSVSTNGPTGIHLGSDNPIGQVMVMGTLDTTDADAAANAGPVTINSDYIAIDIPAGLTIDTDDDTGTDGEITLGATSAAAIDAAAPGEPVLALISGGANLTVRGDVGATSRFFRIDFSSTGGVVTLGGDLFVQPNAVLDAPYVFFMNVTGGSIDVTGNDDGDFVIDTATGSRAGPIWFGSVDPGNVPLNAAGIDLLFDAQGTGGSPIDWEVILPGQLNAASVEIHGLQITTGDVVTTGGTIWLDATAWFDPAITFGGEVIDTTDAGNSSAGQLMLTTGGGGMDIVNGGNPLTLRTDSTTGTDSSITLDVPLIGNGAQLTLQAGDDANADVDINAPLRTGSPGDFYRGLLRIIGDEVTFGGDVEAEGIRVTAQTLVDIDVGATLDIWGGESYFEAPTIANTGNGTIVDSFASGVAMIYRPLLPTDPFDVGDDAPGSDVSDAAIAAVLTDQLQIGHDATQVDTSSDQSGAITIRGGVGFSVAGRYDYQSTFGPPPQPSSVAMADFDHDGNLDVAVALCGLGSVEVLFGNGAGGFTSGTSSSSFGSGPTSLAVGDFNGDSHADLAVANSLSDDVAVLLNDGTGSFTFGSSSSSGGVTPEALTVGYFNADPHLDITVANSASDTVGVLLNDGFGSFTTSSYACGGQVPVALTAADLNGDTRDDLVVVNWQDDVSVLLNNGVGAFPTATLYLGGTSPEDVAVGDFDGSPGADIAVIGTSGDPYVLLNDGTGAFPSFNIIPGIGADGNTLTVGDFDGDGQADLAVAYTWPGQVAIMLGDGSGLFSIAEVFASGGDDPISLAAGDLNNDLKADLAVVNVVSSDLAVFLNEGSEPVLSVNTSLVIQAAGADVSVQSDIDLSTGGGSFVINGSGASTTLSADIVTSGGQVIIDDALLIDGAVTIRTSGALDDVDAGLVTITGPIDGANSGGTDTLTIDAAKAGVDGDGDAAVTITNAVEGAPGAQSIAGGEDLEGLSIDGGQIDLASVTVDEGGIDIEGTGIDLNGATYQTTSSGSVTFTGPVEMATDVQFISTGGNVTFGGTVQGQGADRNLTVTAGSGTVTFGGAVGGGDNIGQIDIDASTLVQDDAIKAQSWVDINVTNALTLDENLTSGGTTDITVADEDAGAATFTLTGGHTISSTAGMLTITADEMDIAGTITATGQTVLLRSYDDGEAIILGGDGTTVDSLELVSAELSAITATTLRIGHSTAGAITVSADVVPANVDVLHLTTGGGVTGTAGGILGNKDLAIQAGDTVDMTDADLAVGTLAVSAPGHNVTFTESDGFSVGDVDGIQGVAAHGVTLTANTGNLTVANGGAANDINATDAIAVTVSGDEATLAIASGASVQSTGGDHTYTADKMDLGGTITATGRTVNLRPNEAGEAIDLGSTTDGASDTLELSDAELDTIAAGTLAIGTPSAGSIGVSQVITIASGKVPILALITGGSIQDSGTTTGELEADELTLAAADIGSDANPLDTTVGSLDVTTTSGDVDLTSTNAASVSVVNISTQGGDVDINHSGGGSFLITGSITTGQTPTQGGNVTITAANELTLAATGSINTKPGGGGKLYAILPSTAAVKM